MAYALLFLACVAAAAYQLSRVRTVWAFLILFVALMPKLPVAVVPGNTTPIRIDDLVLALVIAAWLARHLLVSPRDGDRQPPASPATFFLLLYWGVAAAATLVGIAALTTEPLTGVLHVARLIEYGLLYYLFYTSIDPDQLSAFIEVARTALLLVVAIWIGQHWTHAPASEATAWSTLYPTFSATYDFGGFVMLWTVLLYALFSTGASRSPATMLALAAGAYVTVNSESRGSLVGLALVVLLDVVLRGRWWAVGLLAAAAAAAPYVLRSGKMVRLVSAVIAFATTFDVAVVRQAFSTDPSLALRLRNWSLALEHWRARPFFGDGLGGYLAYTRQYDQPASPDGWYVRVLADSGVAGLVAFLLLIAALAWTLVGQLRRESDAIRRAIVYGAALAVVAASVSAVLVDFFVSYKIMAVFWTIVACGTRVAATEAAAA